MPLAPTETGFSAERLARITAHLDRAYIAPGKIAGCQTLVARHGHVAYFNAQGCMDRERAKPMADDTIFRGWLESYSRNCRHLRKCGIGG